jgi:hypothetical protein
MSIYDGCMQDNLAYRLNLFMILFLYTNSSTENITNLRSQNPENSMRHLRLPQQSNTATSNKKPTGKELPWEIDVAIGELGAKRSISLADLSWDWTLR